ncbi:MAG: hypothetical protein HC935_03285 [Pseudanabaena sp. SU_2_4]|nr:hypothetical protein [Pseudanabaena sp. SU_2_4]
MWHLETVVAIGDMPGGIDHDFLRGLAIFRVSKIPHQQYPYHHSQRTD